MSQLAHQSASTSFYTLLFQLGASQLWVTLIHLFYKDHGDTSHLGERQQLPLPTQPAPVSSAWHSGLCTHWLPPWYLSKIFLHEVYVSATSDQPVKHKHVLNLPLFTPLSIMVFFMHIAFSPKLKAQMPLRGLPGPDGWEEDPLSVLV